MLYRYGMCSRPFDIGCQPSGVVKVEETDPNYFSVIFYERKLTKEEMRLYDLVWLDKPEQNRTVPNCSDS